MDQEGESVELKQFLRCAENSIWENAVSEDLMDTPVIWSYMMGLKRSR